MKHYTGLPIVGDSPAKIIVRASSVKPYTLTYHSKGGHGFDWGTASKERLSMSHSLLMDAFLIGEENTCSQAPKVCKCRNKWITADYVREFDEQVAAKWIKGETFKIDQITICDFIFECKYRNDLVAEPWIEDIAIPEFV